MERRRFTKPEAERLQGQRVRARIDLAQVLAGTEGQVNGWQEAGRQAGFYEVIIRFEPSLTEKPVLKWLSKSDYTAMVEEL